MSISVYNINKKVLTSVYMKLFNLIYLIFQFIYNKTLSIKMIKGIIYIVKIYFLNLFILTLNTLDKYKTLYIQLLTKSYNSYEVHIKRNKNT